MARTIDYLPFAINIGANVEGQSSYVIEPIRLTGHQAGVAKSAVVNKSLRQHSVMVAALANLLSEALDLDVLDDGDVDALKNMLQDVLMGGRSIILTTDLTLYVRSNGSDNNDGLTPSSAFATVQHAVDVGYSTLQLNGHALTIDIGSGTFGSAVVTAPLVGQRGSYALWFAGAGKGSTTIQSQQANFNFNGQASGVISNLRMTSMGGSAWGDGCCVMCHNAQAQVFDVDYGPCSTSGQAFGNQVHSSTGSAIAMGSTDKDYFINISGGGIRHAAGYAGSLVQWWNVKVTLTGTPAYGAFAQSSWGSAVQSGHVPPGTGTAFSGAATGDRFWVDGVSSITTNHGDGGPNFYPGSTPGTVVNNNLQLNYG